MSGADQDLLWLVPEDANATTGRVAPHDLDAEAAVLSAVMTDPRHLGQLHGFLRPEHFYSEAHRRIFEACLALEATESTIDIVLIATWLKDRDRITQVGGVEYLTTVLTAAPAPKNVVDYGAVVYEKWRARRTIEICQTIAARGYVDYGDVQSYIDGAVRDLAAVGSAGMGQAVESNLDALRRIVASLTKQDGEPTRDRKRGIVTGLAPYDALTLGLHAGQKTTVVAWPGVGKTTWALQVAGHVASLGIGVLFFSTEQPRDELLAKMLAARARVDGERMKQGQLTTNEWGRIYESLPGLEKLPLWIEERQNLTIQQLRQITLAHAERLMMVEKVPLGLVILDYVQNLAPAPHLAKAKRHEQLADATRGFKGLCRELKIPGIELAQRKPAEADKNSKAKPRPETGCIADTSEIEKSADNLVVLHREAMKGPGGRAVGEDRETVSAVLLKQRGGRAGEFRMRFQGEFSTFVALRDEDSEPESHETFSDHYPYEAPSGTRPVADVPLRKDVDG